MCRGWKGLALVAACWCLHVPAQAQEGTYPSPVGAARMPEPIPSTPSPTPPKPPPNLVPGPVSPQAAPMGPPDALSLPYDHTGAFQTEQYVQENGFYVHFGPLALQRNHLGAGDIAVYNANAQGIPNPASVIPDPFLPTPAGTASALNFNSVTPALSLGVIGTVGYLWHNQAIEFTSFYTFENDVTTTVSQPYSIDTLFYNPPLTFVGDGLWRYATSVSMTYGSSLFNAEANYRRWNSSFAGLELICGLRYVRQNDILGITSSGTAIVQDTNSLGLPSTGTDQATYEVICHNNIVAPQLGAEWNLPLCRWLTFSLLGKGAWGANYLTTDVNLTRVDGLTAFNTTRNATVFAQVYTVGAYAYVNILERLRLQLGFTANWLTGVASAQDQVDFNLMGSEARQALGLQGVANALQSGNIQPLLNAQQNYPHGNVNNNGSMLYFGPQIELQFFF
ncbi:MAG TPA: hypothetical protein VMF69_15715 [Gemmataceae bacterium]|nr:hypothetical protein [Gemmataceae bacterium]